MILRWQFDLVDTKESALSVYDKTYHTNKRKVRRWENIKILRNCALLYNVLAWISARFFAFCPGSNPGQDHFFWASFLVIYVYCKTTISFIFMVNIQQILKFSEYNSNLISSSSLFMVTFVKQFVQNCRNLIYIRFFHWNRTH